MKFGTWLDNVKRLKGLRQGQVADGLGWTQPKVSTIANGKRKATPDDKAAIETYTKGVTPTDYVTADRDWDDGPDASGAPMRPKARFIEDPNDPTRLVLLK